MAAKSTMDRYGTVAITIHWVAAALIVALLVSGFRVSGAVDPAAKAVFLRFHAAMGMAILVLTLAGSPGGGSPTASHVRSRGSRHCCIALRPQCTCCSMS